MTTHAISVHFASVREAQDAVAALAFRVLSSEDDTILSNPKLAGSVFSVDVQAEDEAGAQDIVKKQFLEVQETEGISFSIGGQTFAGDHEASTPSSGTRKRFLGLF